MYGHALPEIKKTPNGKPYFPGAPHIYFSLSHARTHVLCAISDCPVGVDIESPRVINARTAAYFGSSEELAQFDPLELWVLKESYVKLLDATLPAVKRFRFSRAADMIIPPEKSASSKLYRIGDCIAAASIYGKELPDKVELSNISGIL